MKTKNNLKMKNSTLITQMRLICTDNSPIFERGSGGVFFRMVRGVLSVFNPFNRCHPCAIALVFAFTLQLANLNAFAQTVNIPDAKFIPLLFIF